MVSVETIGPRKRISELSVALGRGLGGLKGQNDARICREHVVAGHTGKVTSASQILPFQEDPIVQGDSSGLSGAGWQWREQHGAKKHGAPMDVSSRRRSGGDPHAEEEDLLEKLRALQADNNTLKRSNARLKAARRDEIRMFSFDWLMANEERCRNWAFVTPTELVEILVELEACHAEEAYNQLAGAHKKRQYNWRDAFCLVLCRLYSMRVYRKLADVANAKVTSMRKAFRIAVIVAAAIARRTCLRTPDRDYIERTRTGMLAEGTEFYEVVQQADGMKVQVMCPSLTDVHRLVHSAYAHMACGQTTITIYANNQVGPSTSFHGGSYGETTCVTDDHVKLLQILKPGDVFVTDKGYYLKDLLRQYYDAIHLKPTEMAGGSGAGMTPEQCAASQKIAQIRSVTERVVLLYKRFDIFGGSPVHMNEWHLMDDYKDIVTMLVMKKGPLPDHLGKVPASGRCMPS
jgi:hypothetical protein